MREGNVFSPVCLFTKVVAVQGPVPNMFKLVQLGLHCTAGHVQTCSTRTPPDMFELVHYYEAWTVGKRAVGIRLKCLIVETTIEHLPTIRSGFCNE